MTFLRVVVRGCLVEHLLRLLDGCYCIRKWGGLCIRDVVGLYRNEGLCSGDLEMCFEDWIGTMCIEA